MISNFCHALFKNQDRKSPTCCLKCGAIIKVFSRLVLVTSTAINHASMHLAKQLFACRHCDYKFSTKNGIKQHLKAHHKESASAFNYIDSTGTYRNEICDMLKRCFEPRLEAVEDQSKTASIGYVSLDFPKVIVIK